MSLTTLKTFFPADISNIIIQYDPTHRDNFNKVVKHIEDYVCVGGLLDRYGWRYYGNMENEYSYLESFPEYTEDDIYDLLDNMYYEMVDEEDYFDIGEVIE